MESGYLRRNPVSLVFNDQIGSILAIWLERLDFDGLVGPTRTVGSRSAGRIGPEWLDSGNGFGQNIPAVLCRILTVLAGFRLERSASGRSVLDFGKIRPFFKIRPCLSESGQPDSDEFV
jgi:hypothetical protein